MEALRSVGQFHVSQPRASSVPSTALGLWGHCEKREEAMALAYQVPVERPEGRRQKLPFPTTHSGNGGVRPSTGGCQQMTYSDRLWGGGQAIGSPVKVTPSFPGHSPLPTCHSNPRAPLPFPGC